MDLYKIEGEKVRFLKPKELAGPKGEYGLQRLIEKNLKEIFGLTFIDTEAVIQGKRLDTLAYDEENQRVVVIEYKKGRDSGVVDQGIAYLSLAHENKEFFELKIEKKLGKSNLEIEWESTKVIFVARKFDDYQICASAIRGVPFELWSYDLYDGLLALRRIEETGTKTSFSTLIKGKKEQLGKISQEIRTYDLEYHLKKTKEELRQIFEGYRREIKAFGLEVLEVIDQKVGITYKNNKKSFARIEFDANAFRIIFKEKAGFVDPKNLSKDIREYKWGFERMARVTSQENFDDTVYLLKQAYETTA